MRLNLFDVSILCDTKLRRHCDLAILVFNKNQSTLNITGHFKSHIKEPGWPSRTHPLGSYLQSPFIPVCKWRCQTEKAFKQKLSLTLWSSLCSGQRGFLNKGPIYNLKSKWLKTTWWTNGKQTESQKGKWINGLCQMASAWVCRQ